MKIAYEDWTPKAATEELVDTAESIIRDYQQQGYVLTLRQLYYQFVARDLIPNSERSYKNLGTAMTKARMAGLISWTAIEDRSRGHSAYSLNEDEEEALKGIEWGIIFDYWKRQGAYVEVWVEKEALGNVIAAPCRALRVPYMSCKGYLSASEAWRAGQRFYEAARNGRKTVMIHLGDHDPSGLDMTRDNRQRLQLFAETNGIDVRRIALNRDQIDQYAPPPNPAKVTDSRAADYIARHGDTSWELDALEPSVIDALIRDEIATLVDDEVWQMTRAEERVMQSRLKLIRDEWPTVKEYLNTLAGD